MKYTLAGFIMALLVGCASPLRHKPTSVPIGFATEANATLIAVVYCEHKLFPGPEPYPFYFKPDNEPHVGYLAGGMFTSLHGEEGNTGTFSAGIGFTPRLKQGIFELDFTSHYFSSTNTSTESFTLSTPIGKDLSGTNGNVKYKIEWKEP